MDNLTSIFSYRESVEELHEKVLSLTYELGSAKMEVEEEARKNRENMETMNKLVHLLEVVVKERDEARDQVQTLLQTSYGAPAILSPENPLFNTFPGRTNSGLTESNNLSGDAIYDVVSPVVDSWESRRMIAEHENRIINNIANGRKLPEKGHLLLAVMEAGPLLGTLLVVAPLPQWQKPPVLQSLLAPPVPIGGYDVNNQGGSQLFDNPYGYANVYYGPSTPSSSSQFHNNSTLDFSAGGLVFPAGAQMFPAAKRHRIE